jgi:ADP-ribose pyrophosphatase
VTEPEDPVPFPPLRRLRSERIYASHWCGLRRDFIELPNGHEQEYHVFEIPDAVAVVPVLQDGSIVMIGQYRYPHGKTHWEVPAGRISNGENPETSAEREMLEETGYRPARLVQIPGFYPTNGISAHYAYAFVGVDCERVTQPRPDASERLTVRVFSREQTVALLRSGRIADAFTALSLFYYLSLVGR